MKLEKRGRIKILLSTCLVGVNTMWDGGTNRVDDLVEENLGPNLFLCRVADTVHKLAPPRRPLISVPEGEQGANYQISWTPDDDYNPAVAYELVELLDHIPAINYVFLQHIYLVIFPE